MTISSTSILGLHKTNAKITYEQWETQWKSELHWQKSYWILWALLVYCLPSFTFKRTLPHGNTRVTLCLSSRYCTKIQTEIGETLEEASQGSCGCPTLEGVQDHLGWSSELLSLVESVPDHGRGLEGWSSRPPSNPNHSDSVNGACQSHQRQYDSYCRTEGKNRNISVELSKSQYWTRQKNYPPISSRHTVIEKVYI